ASPWKPHTVPPGARVAAPAFGHSTFHPPGNRSPHSVSVAALNGPVLRGGTPHGTRNSTSTPVRTSTKETMSQPSSGISCTRACAVASSRAGQPPSIVTARTSVPSVIVAPPSSRPVVLLLRRALVHAGRVDVVDAVPHAQAQQPRARVDRVQAARRRHRAVPADLDAEDAGDHQLAERARRGARPVEQVRPLRRRLARAALDRVGRLLDEVAL